MNRRLGWDPELVLLFWRRKMSLVPQRPEPWTVQPIA